MNRELLMIGATAVLWICACAPATAENSEANSKAAVAGWYISAATRCGLPSAPFEAELDRYILEHGIAPTEGARLKTVMMYHRSASPIRVGDQISCDDVNKALQKIAPAAPGAATNKGNRR